MRDREGSHVHLRDEDLFTHPLPYTLVGLAMLLATFLAVYRLVTGIAALIG